MSTPQDDESMQQAVAQALRMRYGSDREEATCLQLLKLASRQMAKAQPSGNGLFEAAALMIGRLIAAELILGKTEFLERLLDAARHDQGGINVSDTIALAYDEMRLECLQAELGAAAKEGREPSEPDAIFPRRADVVARFMQIRPGMKYESAEAQVKRWLAQTGNKVAKRQ